MIMLKSTRKEKRRRKFDFPPAKFIEYKKHKNNRLWTYYVTKEVRKEEEEGGSCISSKHFSSSLSEKVWMGLISSQGDKTALQAKDRTRVSSSHWSFSPLWPRDPTTTRHFLTSEKSPESLLQTGRKTGSVANNGFCVSEVCADVPAPQHTLGAQQLWTSTLTLVYSRGQDVVQLF